MTEEIVEQPNSEAYNSAKYEGKHIIICGVPSTKEGSIQFRHLLRYIKERGDRISVCATSTGQYYDTGGYEGYEAIQDLGVGIHFLGKEVWYESGKRRFGDEAAKELHGIFETRFDGQQIVLLRPGTPKVGDKIVMALLHEPKSDEQYLVIDDPQASIFQIMDEAIEALNITQDIERKYVPGNMVTEAKDLNELLIPGKLSAIMSTATMYDQSGNTDPLLVRVINRLLKHCKDSLSIYITASDRPSELMDLGEFHKLVCENIELHKNTHYTLIIYLPEDNQYHRQ